MDSAVSGHVEVVKVLLGRGADPTIKNQRGKTALDLAKACPGEVFEREAALATRACLFLLYVYLL